MAFNAGTILATMKLNAKSFNSQVGAAQKGLKGLSAKMLNVQNLIQGTFAGAFVIAGFKLADMGGRVRDLEAAFDKLSIGSGTTADNIIKDVRKITGSLTRKQIQESANMLELLGVGMENTARMTEIAKAAATALNRSVPQMLESISTGTARQSRLWLDNLGIIISVEEANRSYAAQLGKTAKELTDTEQRAAFLNAVLSKGDEIIAKVGKEAGRASEPTREFAAALGDIKGTLAAGTSESTGGLFAGGAKFLRWLDNVAQKSQKAGKELDDMMSEDRLRGLDFKDPRRGLFEDTLADPTDFFQRRRIFKRPDTLALALERSRFKVELERATSPLGGFGPAGGPTSPLAVDPSLFEKVIDPGLSQSAEAMEIINMKFETGRELIGNMASAMDLFGVAVGRGERGAQAFGAAMLGAAGNMASAFGDFFVQSGRAMVGLIGLNPFLTVAAGLALKALGGILKGTASGISTTQGIATLGEVATPNEQRTEGHTSIIVQGDFVGDPVWIDRLAEKLRIAQRDRSVEVVFAG